MSQQQREKYGNRGQQNSSLGAGLVSLGALKVGISGRAASLCCELPFVPLFPLVGAVSCDPCHVCLQFAKELAAEDKICGSKTCCTQTVKSTVSEEGVS